MARATAGRGATTNSDKLRVLLSRIKRQHDGAMDYPTAHSWARDIAAPLRDALVSLEDKTGKTSEVLNLLLDHVTASLAMIVSHTLLPKPRLQSLKSCWCVASSA
jgi:hypothetical protein